MTIAELEVWAGVECTVNRVGDRYFDQLERNGHASRPQDLDLFAQLGVRAIRYPVLWERVAPEGLSGADWLWTDDRLNRLRALGIRPIAGLVHHGSGPHYTSLVDPNFATGLAEFARAVADRYPWVTDYTPVNEPLTTARFSGLYGHWYPHGRDGQTFARTLLVQCRATVLAMRAVREVNPAARLIQTEDLGKTHSTPKLAYQADFENERRWASFDLLCGKLTRDRPMWKYLRSHGISETELNWFLQNPCPPDLLGLNHYLTSERFLDEHLEHYPIGSHGGNGRHCYADVEAARCHRGADGPKQLIKEAWERYKLPIAVTEVHAGCSREEQLRWLKEIWDAARQLRSEGADVRAVTAWALLGSYDWNTLVTRADGYYESGVFDVRGKNPRPTAIAQMLKAMAAGREPEHPLLDVPGWWHRSDRLLYSPHSRSASPHTPTPPPPPTPKGTPCSHSALSTFHSALSAPSSSRPIAIVGATGTLGSAFARVCEKRAIPYRLLSRREMDITDRASVERVLDELNPWAVVNAAGYVRVDDAEREPEACLRANTEGPAILAAACGKRSYAEGNRHKIALLTFSSDLVFDGAYTNPYKESNAVAPLSVYGRSKAEAEKRVLQSLPSALVVRTSAFFGPWDEYNFITIALRQLAAGQIFAAAGDAIVSPTYVPDLVNTSLDLLIDGEGGVWHLANPSEIAWAELARWVAKLAGVKTGCVEARPMRELGLVAPRPSYSVLGSDRGVLLPGLDSAIDRYLRDRVV